MKSTSDTFAKMAREAANKARELHGKMQEATPRSRRDSSILLIGAQNASGKAASCAVMAETRPDLAENCASRAASYLQDVEEIYAAFQKWIKGVA